MRDETAYDKRYTITSEYIGYSSPRFVLRFLGSFVNAHITMESAIQARREHSKRRIV